MDSDLASDATSVEDEAFREQKKEKQCLAVDEEVREQPAEKTLSDFERLSASTSRCNEELTDVDETNFSAGAF